MIWLDIVFVHCIYFVTRLSADIVITSSNFCLWLYVFTFTYLAYILFKLEYFIFLVRIVQSIVGLVSARNTCKQNKLQNYKKTHQASSPCWSRLCQDLFPVNVSNRSLETWSRHFSVILRDRNNDYPQCSIIPYVLFVFNSPLYIIDNYW